MEATDSELMSCLKAGDDLALNQLMDRWAARVTSFLQRMTGSRDVACDLAQETFVKLYNARGKYRAGESFSTYLFAIAANLARNHYRWKKRHPSISWDELETQEAQESQLLDPEQAAESREKIASVRKAIAQLPSELREAFTLFIDEEMSHVQIATVVGCSPKAVETRIYRARQMLKNALADF